MNEESMETVRNSCFCLSSEDWGFIHGFGIPHYNFRVFGLPVVDEAHAVSVVDWGGVVFLVEENFTGSPCFSKWNVFDQFLLLEIVFYEAFEILAISTNLSINWFIEEFSDVGVSCLVANI